MNTNLYAVVDLLSLHYHTQHHHNFKANLNSEAILDIEWYVRLRNVQE